jgi:hypothetical protein
VRTLDPEKRFAPPPPAPPPDLARREGLSEPAKEEKKEEKKPVVDPKTALFLPLGVFGVFLFLSLIVLVVALVTKPHPSSAESGEPSVTQP